MNARTGGLLNTTLVRDYVCAQCRGPLVEKVIDGAPIVLCPKSCAPGGFVTRSFAEYRQTQDTQEFYEVLNNYPQLDPRPTLSPEQVKKDKLALFGEE